MPNIITNVDWTQTENSITVKVPIKGLRLQSKTDIFCSERYIKVSYEQYFFEALLSHPIKSKESTCTIIPDNVLLELVKNEAKMWEKLELDVSKQEKQTLKKQYIEEEHERIQREQAELCNKKSELKRLAVREQMALDAEQRENIKAIKENEKVNALKDMKMWRNEPKQQIKKVVKNELPPPRLSQIVNVCFTPRDFPTPCRESRLEEENEWLRKQAEARRSVGFVSEDLRPEEHNPQFLKSKGDLFLQSRNFLAAVSAYSFGIKLNDKFADLYVGRAEAHLALGNFHKSLQDCTKALDLMKPEVPSNLRQRSLCIGYRGICLLNLGLVQQGIGELKASLNLQPNENFSLKLEEANELNTA